MGHAGDHPSSRLLGVDFSCAPTARKPIVLAWGRRAGAVVRLDRLEPLTTVDALTATLRGSAGFLAGFDFPFGLPRPFVAALRQSPPPGFASDLTAALQGRSSDRPAPIDQLLAALHRHCGTRAGFQALVDGWGRTWQANRPAGPKLLHRVTDTAVPGLSSTSPLQTRYVPVGKMYFEGVAGLLAADLTLPGLRQGRADALGFEAYPGLLAGELVGRRSYKSDNRASENDPDRLIARRDLINALEQGRTRLGLRLKLSPAQHDLLASDPKGDRLDAVLCLMQAAWADLRHEQGAPNHGLPDQVDPLEGWILTA